MRWFRCTGQRRHSDDARGRALAGTGSDTPWLAVRMGLIAGWREQRSLGVAEACGYRSPQGGVFREFGHSLEFVGKQRNLSELLDLCDGVYNKKGVDRGYRGIRLKLRD